MPLLRQSVYSRLAGYEDTNDAERLAQDPAMRVIVGRRGPERQAASTNTMSRFETEVLTQKHNLEGVTRMSAQWVDSAMAHTPHRRVVAKVEWHLGELFPRVGFIVTNMSAGPEGVVHFYNGRGTAEQWIKEGKYALNWTRLSCHRFVANQVRLAHAPTSGRDRRIRCLASDLCINRLRRPQCSFPSITRANRPDRKAVTFTR